MLRRAFRILKDAATGFFADEALTRAAAIAYFALFSLGPLLFIATGLAGLVFGHAAVGTALSGQMRGMLGQDAARAIDQMIEGAMGQPRGALALAIGLGTLLLTASGAFGALQSALNAVWKVEAPAEDSISGTISAFMRAKAGAMGLVATTGFLLLVSLAASAALHALGDWFARVAPGFELLLEVLNAALSLGLIALMFAAIYKVLPDRRLQWRDVGLGAVATALLFSLGKSAIGFYVAQIDLAKAFGAAGTLAVLLLWLYYSAVIFLLGAELTRAWSGKEEARPEDAAAARGELPPTAPSSSARPAASASPRAPAGMRRPVPPSARAPAECAPARFAPPSPPASRILPSSTG